MSAELFCFAAERDGRCMGVTAADYEVDRFYRDFAGYDIKSFKTRADWDAYCAVTPFGPADRKQAAP